MANSWAADLKQLKEKKNPKLSDLFSADDKRGAKYCADLIDKERDVELHFDYSMNLFDEEILGRLLKLAADKNVFEFRHRMFSGDKINLSENRAVLHTALRTPSSEQVLVDGVDVIPKVHEVLQKMKTFSNALLSGEWTGVGGKIQNVVNIGIGGSDLGPRMVSDALWYFHVKNGPKVHFVSNVDASQFRRILRGCQPETTLFIIVSKTFTTRETLMNADMARRWFLKGKTTKDDIHKHFVAVSTNEPAVKEFGIDPSKGMFGFWDWVGGRFSMWSAVGLAITCSIGFDNFEKMLAGAYATDLHFKTAEPAKNIPLLMALLEVWYINGCSLITQGVIPYDANLSLLRKYLQQLEMESNGKSYDRQGKKINDYNTCAIIWGEPGTDAQHSFFQLLHQGTPIAPLDFIMAVNPPDADASLGETAEDAAAFRAHHAELASNCFAQLDAFMAGKSVATAKAELEKANVAPEKIEQLKEMKAFDGNRPSSLFLMPQLTPANLGALIALYEHKVFCMGIIWNINSFDQFGVELGKVLAKAMLPALTGAGSADGHNSATAHRIEMFKKLSN